MLARLRRRRRLRRGEGGHLKPADTPPAVTEHRGWERLRRRLVPAQRSSSRTVDHDTTIQMVPRPQVVEEPGPETRMFRASGAPRHAEQPKTAGQLVRYEAKYWLHPAQIPAIRAFTAHFCQPDRHAHGEPPQYRNLTLQLDTPHRSFYHAGAADAYSRFKLRVRTYGTRPEDTVVLEIKRKIGANVIKSRARMPLWRFSRHSASSIDRSLYFRDPEERQAYGEFVRLVQECGVEPVVLIGYDREPWFSCQDDYARVTIDTNLCYQSTSSWDSWGRRGCWRPFEYGARNGPVFSGAILELKSTNHVPQWMQDMITRFDLTRSGICKYTMAVDCERAIWPDDHLF